MSTGNQERVGKELERLNRRLKPFVIHQMSSIYGTSWQQEAQKSIRDPHWTKGGNLHLDTSALLNILRDQWENIFHQVPKPRERNVIGELLRVRRKWAHQETLFDTDINCLLKNIEEVCTWIDPNDAFSRPASSRAYTPYIDSDANNDSSLVLQTTIYNPPVPRRVILKRIVGVALIGTSIFLCGQVMRATQQDQTGIAPTGTTQEPTVSPQVPLLFTYKGHAKEVDAVVWSPDSTRIASGSSDDTVQVWTAINGSNVLVYHGHSDNVNAVAWSPNGQQIASGSSDITAQVWNASDRTHIFTYAGHFDSVNTVVWSPDGKRIASGSSDNTVQIWNAGDGSNAFTYTGHHHGVWSLAWSPDGQRIASCGNDGVQVWNAKDGSNAFTYAGHSGWVTSVAWSPDGQRIASCSWDNTVQVWNASNGTHIYTYLGHSNVVTSVAWSPDSTRIASSSWDHTVQVWNASDGSNVFTYTGHSDDVDAVAWSPNGRQIASCSRDETVQVWRDM